MECPNCNRTYDDEFKFCPYCGEEKPKPKICPNCELEPNVEFSFCPECGTKLLDKAIFLEEIGEVEELILMKQYQKAIVKCNNLLRNKFNKNRINSLRDEATLKLEKEKKESLFQYISDKKIPNYPKEIKPIIIEMIENETITTETEIDKEIILYINKEKQKLQNYLNATKCNYIKIRKEIENKIDNGEISKNEQIETEMETLTIKEKDSLIKYLSELNIPDYEKDIKPTTIEKIENEILLTEKQVDEEISENIKIHKRELLNYINDLNFVDENIKRKIKNKINYGELTKTEQIDKEIIELKEKEKLDLIRYLRINCDIPEVRERIEKEILAGNITNENEMKISEEYDSYLLEICKLKGDEKLDLSVNKFIEKSSLREYDKNILKTQVKNGMIRRYSQLLKEFNIRLGNEVRPTINRKSQTNRNSNKNPHNKERTGNYSGSSVPKADDGYGRRYWHDLYH